MFKDSISYERNDDQKTVVLGNYKITKEMAKRGIDFDEINSCKVGLFDTYYHYIGRPPLEIFTTIQELESYQGGSKLISSTNSSGQYGTHEFHLSDQRKGSKSRFEIQTFLSPGRKNQILYTCSINHSLDFMMRHRKPICDEGHDLHMGTKDENPGSCIRCNLDGAYYYIECLKCTDYSICY